LWWRNRVAFPLKAITTTAAWLTGQMRKAVIDLMWQETLLRISSIRGHPRLSDAADALLKDMRSRVNLWRAQMFDAV
jgi:hypothetical protein